MNRPALGVGVVLFKKTDPSRILLIREKQDSPQYGKVAGMYSIPGGHVEEGESLTQAALREVKEETGCVCTLVSFLGCYQIKNAVGIFFAGSLDEKMHPVDGDGTEICSFIDKAEYEELTGPFRPALRTIISDYFSGINYPLTLVQDCR